jgi:hypothetical protein
MEYFRFTGMPSYNIDFKSEKIENYGFGHSTLHKEISQFTYKNGLWELDGEYLSGSCCDEGEAYTGYYNQRNYTYECTVNPQKGDYHLLLFRVQGGIRSYAFGFYGKNRIALIKKHKDQKVILEKPYSYEYGEDYNFKIEVLEDKITAYINHEKILEGKDNSYRYGQIGIGIYHGSHCHFKNIRVNDETMKTDSAPSL